MIYGALPYKAHNNTKLDRNARARPALSRSRQGRAERMIWPRRGLCGDQRRSLFLRGSRAGEARAGESTRRLFPFSSSSSVSLFLARRVLLVPSFVLLPLGTDKRRSSSTFSYHQHVCSSTYPFQPSRWNGRDGARVGPVLGSLSDHAVVFPFCPQCVLPVPRAILLSRFFFSPPPFPLFFLLLSSAFFLQS